VRETNDASFISALLDMNCETALSMGIRKGSACSPGAAVSALSFALESGATSSRLIEYSTSLEVVASPSFVGYAAMSFEP
jgi:AmmeMemoRadiSam system protein B